MSHPTDAELNLYRREELTEPRLMEVETHLEEGCDFCLDRLEQIHRDEAVREAGLWQDGGIVMPKSGHSVGVPVASANGATDFKLHTSFGKSNRPPNSAELLDVPEQPDRYQNLGKKDEGGGGVLYKVLDRKLDRVVAFKVLLKKHEDDPSIRARFNKEAQMGSRLQHPNIVPVYDRGYLADGRPYFTMRLVHGETLADLLESRTAKQTTLHELLLFFQQLCRAMAYAHRQGIIHRDLKPSNIMVDKENGGMLVVIDLGVAKKLAKAAAVDAYGTERAQAETESVRAMTIDTAYEATQVGWIMGTLRYMAPEQARGKGEQLDERCDVFALGAILCEILTKQPPYSGPTHEAIRREAQQGNLQDALVRLDSCGADEQLVRLTKDCLAVEPSQRPRDAEAVERKVTAYLASVQERLQAVEVERAAAQVRAEEAQARAAAEAQAREAAQARAEEAKARADAEAQARAAAEARTAEERAKVGAVRRARHLLAGLAAAVAGLAIVSIVFVFSLRAVQIKTKTERHDFQLQSATLALEKGLELCENGETGPGMHWLVRSLELLAPTDAENPPTDAENLRRVIRVNLAGWRSRLSPLHALLQHQEGLTLVAFSPDGQLFLTGSSDGTARLWETATGAPKAVLQHKGPIQAAAFSPNGELLVTGTMGGAVRLWDTGTGRARPDLPYGHRGEVHTVGFSPDGRTILSGGEDGFVRLLDVATNRSRFEPTINHGSPVATVAFSPNGQKILTGSRYQKPSRLWDAATGKECPGSPPQHSLDVRAVAFSPDGDIVAAGCADGSARWWKTRTGQLLKPLVKHDREVVAVTFSRDGQFVATASADWTAQLWNTTTQQPLGLPFLHPGKVTGVSFSPDDKTIATWGADNNVRVWKVSAKSDWIIKTTPKPVGSLLWNQNEVSGVAFSPDGRLVLTGSTDGFARLWETPSATPPGLSLTNSLPVSTVAFSPDGRTAVTGTVGRPEFWDVADGATGQRLDLKNQPIRPVLTIPLDILNQLSSWMMVPLPHQHTGSIRALAISPNGQFVLTGGTDMSARLWDRVTGKRHVLSRLHGKPIDAVALDDRTAVTASRDGTARLWDVTTRRERPGSDLKHAGPVVAAALSPDGTTVVTGSHDGTARLWEASTGHELPCSPLEHHSEVLAVAFSRDNKMVVTGCKDGTAWLWNKASGQCRELLGHQAAVTCVVFSPNGRHVLTAGKDKMARLWDIATGTSVAPPLRHQGWVTCAAFSPDGAVVLTGSDDRMARLWDVATGQPYGPPIAHRREVNAVAFNPNGRGVLTGSADRSARLSEVPIAVKGEAERIALWVEVLTGMKLDKEGVLHSLSDVQWENRKHRLSKDRDPLLP